MSPVECTIPVLIAVPLPLFKACFIKLILNLDAKLDTISAVLSLDASSTTIISFFIFFISAFLTFSKSFPIVASSL